MTHPLLEDSWTGRPALPTPRRGVVQTKIGAEEEGEKAREPAGGSNERRRETVANG